MDDYLVDLIKNDEDYQRKYIGQYSREMQRKLEELPEDSRGLLLDGLKTMRFNPSDNPKLDAELNLLRLEKKLSSKKRLSSGSLSVL